MQALKDRQVHQVSNKEFSSLFSIQNSRTDQIITSALALLGLENVQFTSLESVYLSFVLGTVNLCYFVARFHLS
jgi:hypothetical protein